MAKTNPAKPIQSNPDSPQGAVQVKRKTGRPRTWGPGGSITEAQRAQILEALKSGTSLRQAATRASVLPSIVLDLIREDERFAEQYARAREVGWSLLGDSVLEVADDASLQPDARRVMLDARRWILSKMLPRIYGDSPQVSVNLSVNAAPRYVAAAEVIEQTQDAPKLPE